MIEKTTQRFHAPRMKRAGRVIPLRSLPEASHRAAESNALSLPSLRQETVDATLHAIQNCLQTVSVGLDLVQLTDVIEQQDYDPIRGSIDRAGRLLLELREYCCPSGGQRWTANLAEVVEDVVQAAAREWERPGRATRVLCHDSEEGLATDWGQIEKTLARTIFCAYVILPPEGGEVIIEARTRTIGIQRFIDIRVRTHGVVPFSVEEDTLFFPLASLNGHQLGLSLVLAQLAASRLGGHLLFHKLSPRQACFKLWFRV